MVIMMFIDMISRLMITLVLMFAICSVLSILRFLFVVSSHYIIFESFYSSVFIKYSLPCLS